VLAPTFEEADGETDPKLAADSSHSLYLRPSAQAKAIAAPNHLHAEVAESSPRSDSIGDHLKPASVHSLARGSGLEHPARKDCGYLQSRLKAFAIHLAAPKFVLVFGSPHIVAEVGSLQVARKYVAHIRYNLEFWDFHTLLLFRTRLVECRARRARRQADS
jgi:hypothetical protein